MSWSVNAMGKASAVAQYVEKQLHQYKCSEPEESIKERVIGIVADAASAAPDCGMSIVAYGSQSDMTNAEGVRESRNNVKLEINSVTFAG